MTTVASRPWYEVANVTDLPSPAFLVYPQRVEENLRRMRRIAGDPARLRPHVKTHKLAQVVKLELEHGVRKFKAATIAECEMCAAAGAPDVLLAYQPVGPNVARLLALVARFPATKFSCLIDSPAALAALADTASVPGKTVGVLLDLNIGLDRTGVDPGPAAFELYRQLCRCENLRPAGLHVFDAHLHGADQATLARHTASAYAPVWQLRDQLRAAGLPVPTAVVGGTPTFPVLAEYDGVELGAGTPVLWDLAHAEKCPYLDFVHAAVLLARVISRPGRDRLCLDLGHKAVASEMPPPRVALFGLEDARFVIHNEEHLVLETARVADYPLGTAVYGIPRHICPTVALQSEVLVVRDGRVTETWPLPARARRLSI